MTFSDDDLKRLKEAMGDEGDACSLPHGFPMNALIARLEAGESGFMEYHGLEMSKGCKCRCCSEWRKAAGK